METMEFTIAELLGTLNKEESKRQLTVLYAAGDIDLCRRGSRISVVGSRKATPEGLKRAELVTKALVRHGITVVSGLAEGIDTAAHETAISEGGNTIAVLGTPLDEFYPPKNRSLQERIMRDHLAVSQFPIGYPMKRSNFPMRNLTMSLLTDATVIVEATENSGTLHQAKETLRLGRQLLIMESVLTNPELNWPKEMMKYGAIMLSRGNMDHILAEMPERTDAEPFSL